MLSKSIHGLEATTNYLISLIDNVSSIFEIYLKLWYEKTRKETVEN